MMASPKHGCLTQNVCENLFAALGLLHERNILHGDARKENAILVQDSVKWIDFLDSCVDHDPSSIHEKRIELVTLMKSCFGGQVVEARLIELAKTYNGTAKGAREISLQLSNQ